LLKVKKKISSNHDYEKTFRDRGSGFDVKLL